jgi:hypothetical protein
MQIIITYQGGPRHGQSRAMEFSLPPFAIGAYDDAKAHNMKPGVYRLVDRQQRHTATDGDTVNFVWKED